MSETLDLFAEKPKSEQTICPHCGAKNVEYRFSINKGLVSAMRKVFDPKIIQLGVKISKEGLTYSEFTNFPKLRYWGLIRPFMNEESKKKRGWWQLTEMGRKFMLGQSQVLAIAVTVRGKVVRHEGPEVYIGDIFEGWKFRSDYAQQVKGQL